MHIVECAFEAGGFDIALMRGGMSHQVWYTALALANESHQVSIITPAHGAADYLRATYGAELIEYAHAYTMPVVLDPAVWPGFPGTVDIPLKTAVYRAVIEGLPIYYLSNDLLDLLPDTLYPPAASEGRDLSFFKSLAFQLDCVAMLRSFWPGERLIVHAHEPFYHYAISAALRDSADYRMVSTVNSNMPINKGIYRPQLAATLAHLGVDPDLAPLDGPQPDNEFDRVMGDYLPSTRLYQPQGPDYVCLVSLIASCSDAVEFLSEGQRDYFLTVRDTPFEELFQRLTVSRILKRHASKLFVGGSATTGEWMTRDAATVDRAAVLAGLGLDPTRATFYHAARYSPHHKGQLELMRAIDQVLGGGLEANFIVRCVTGSGPGAAARSGDPYFQAVADRYPGNVVLDWTMAAPETLFQHAASADFCVFPSKFELESFLIAQAEAMACGAVPIGTAQEGTRHFGHAADPAHATGFGVRRSFREDDPRLVADLVARIHEARTVFDADPDRYQLLSRRSRMVARQFTWATVARRHLRMYESMLSGSAPAGVTDDDAIRYGWFDQLSPAAWEERRSDIERRAEELGDCEAYGRCRPLNPSAYRVLFEAAFNRADFRACEQIVAVSRLVDLGDRLRDRCRLTRDRSGLRVEYTFEEAEAVELFHAAETTAPRRTVGPLQLAPRARSFTISLGEIPAERLFFLLTLRSGRSAWDEVAVRAPAPRTPIGVS